MKRKIITGLLCLTMVFGLAACSSTGGTGTPADSNTAGSEVAEGGEMMEGAIGSCVTNSMENTIWRPFQVLCKLKKLI